jgi:hypothetical protein
MIERLPRGQFRQLEHERGGRLFERERVANLKQDDHSG